MIDIPECVVTFTTSNWPYVGVTFAFAAFTAVMATGLSYLILYPKRESALADAEARGHERAMVEVAGRAYQEGIQGKFDPQPQGSPQLWDEAIDTQTKLDHLLGLCDAEALRKYHDRYPGALSMRDLERLSPSPTPSPSA